MDNHIFKELFFASPVAAYVCDQEGYIIAYNEAAAELWGRRPDLGVEKWTGASATYRTDGNPIKPAATPMALAVLKQQPVDAEELIIERPDASRRTILVTSKIIEIGPGKNTGGYNTLIDITDYKQIEENKAILSEIVHSADDAIISENIDGIIISWNSGAERIFGYQESEIIGKPFHILIPSYLKGEEKSIISQIQAGHRVDNHQTLRLAKSGKEIPITLTASPIRDKMGQIIGISKTARDISDKIEREQTIRFHAQKLEALHAIGKLISEQLATASIIQTVIDSTTQLAAAAVGICFYQVSDDQGNSKLSFALATPTEGKDDYPNIHIEESVIHSIFKDGTTAKFENVCEIPHILSLFQTREGSKAPQIKHCLALPIRSAGKSLIGAMFFGYTRLEDFLAADEETISSIVSLVGVTLDNARLFDEVKALNERKSEFIALASHELKTPLTTTKGYLQILERAQIDQVGRRFLNKALKQLERINALVAELLDISKIEAGKLSLHLETFDLGEMILDVVETFHFSSQTHTVFVHNTQADYTVNADRQRMEQVLINLITNAIKFSPQAHRVDVHLKSSDADVTVHVVDEGVGMSSEQQQKIFTRFYQVEGSSRMTGLGLGLYLSKEIVRRHGGYIGLTSELGKGSTFYFSIPRQPIEK